MAFESSQISLDGGVADLSYRSQQWPEMQFNGHTSSQVSMRLGDPVSGPYVTLSVATPDAEDAWTRTHSHGTDQFRVIMRGTTRAVGRHVLRPGQFAFQEAGMLYREGIGGRDDDVWTFLVLGDRRGAVGSLPWGDNGNPKFDVPDEVLKAYAAAAALLPGGPNGIPGVVTTLGTCRQRYLGGSFDDARSEGEGWRALAPGVTAAVAAWGEKETGPVALLVHAAPGSAALPQLTTGTESVFLVVGGSCMVGEAELASGDLRLMADGLALSPVMAGDDGLDALLFVADRRALPAVEGDAVWQDAIDTLLGEVVPVAHVV